MDHFQIPGMRRVPLSKFHTWGPWGPTVLEWPVNLIVICTFWWVHVTWNTVICKGKNCSIYVENIRHPWCNWMLTCDVWLCHGRECYGCETWWDGRLVVGQPPWGCRPHVPLNRCCVSRRHSGILIVGETRNLLQKCASFRFWVRD